MGLHADPLRDGFGFEFAGGAGWTIDPFVEEVARLLPLIEWDKEKQAKGIELIQPLGIKGGTWLPDGLNHATVQHLFGDIRQREGLELEERSMITWAALIALGRTEEQLIHFRGALGSAFRRRRSRR